MNHHTSSTRCGFTQIHAFAPWHSGKLNHLEGQRTAASLIRACTCITVTADKNAAAVTLGGAGACHSACVCGGATPFTRGKSQHRLIPGNRQNFPPFFCSSLRSHSRGEMCALDSGTGWPVTQVQGALCRVGGRSPDSVRFFWTYGACFHPHRPLNNCKRVRLDE